MNVSRDIPPRMQDRLIVALDVPRIAEAERIVRDLDGIVSFFKVGYWLLLQPGGEALIDAIIASGKRVFLDCKIYDIGQTVRRGVAAAASRGVSLITVHGDAEIMRAAVDGRGTHPCKVFGISVLTSLDDAALVAMGYRLTVQEMIGLRVRTALECGCDGMIASSSDDPDAIRRQHAADRLLIATPGIRLPDAAADDHKRLTTPAEAIARGADYLVVGRPILDPASTPRVQAERIVADMEIGGATA